MFNRTAIAAGLTALELLIVMAVIGVIASTGVPLLRDAVWNARRTAAVNTLLGAVQQARSTAQSRHTTVVLCQTSDRLRCAQAPTDGSRWIVTERDPPDGNAPAAGPLRDIELHLAGTVTGNRSAFEFRPFPKASTNGTITLCDPRGPAAQRAIVISSTGRPRIATVTNQAGFAACTVR